MNRRQFLKGLGASAAALVVPAAKRDERDSEIAFWKQRAEVWEHLFFEWAKETNQLRHRIGNMKEVMERQKELAADLAVQAAYWQEQYEQVVTQRDHFYQGQSHTEDEWQAHLLEQDHNA